MGQQQNHLSQTLNSDQCFCWLKASRIEASLLGTNWMSCSRLSKWTFSSSNFYSRFLSSQSLSAAYFLAKASSTSKFPRCCWQLLVVYQSFRARIPSILFTSVLWASDRSPSSSVDLAWNSFIWSSSLELVLFKDWFSCWSSTCSFPDDSLRDSNPSSSVSFSCFSTLISLANLWYSSWLFFLYSSALSFSSINQLSFPPSKILALASSCLNSSFSFSSCSLCRSNSFFTLSQATSLFLRSPCSSSILLVNCLTLSWQLSDSLRILSSKALIFPNWLCLSSLYLSCWEISLDFRRLISEVSQSWYSSDDCLRSLFSLVSCWISMFFSPRSHFCLSSQESKSRISFPCCSLRLMVPSAWMLLYLVSIDQIQDLLCYSSFAILSLSASFCSIKSLRSPSCAALSCLFWYICPSRSADLSQLSLASFLTSSSSRAICDW